MFDISNPQKRERLLVIVAGIALCVIVVMVLPGQFSELTRLQARRAKFQTDIENLERHARNKDEIQKRLLSMERLAFASALGTPRNMAVSSYQDWLMGLAQGAGLGGAGRNVKISDNTAAGVKDIYDKSGFTLESEGRLEQIAEFLRRFHRTDYLHMITSVSPRPMAGNPDVFAVTFKIEVLALPQVRIALVPGADGASIAMNDEERQMMEIIRSRAILSEYAPLRSERREDNEVERGPPPPPPFDLHTNFCVVVHIGKVDGRPQCWINHRTEGRMYYLFEGGTFMLDGVEAIIRKIEVDAGRIHVAAAGGVYTIPLGKAFSDTEEPSYFLTDIVDADGNPWTAQSTGEPHCIVVHGLGAFVGGRLRITEERARYLLAAVETFPMSKIAVTIRSIEPMENQIQMEAAGAVYIIRVNGSFSEFNNE